MLDISLSDCAHQVRRALIPLGRKKKVHMIRHQDIGMDRTTVESSKFLDEAQVQAVVQIVQEAAHAVMATLDDVKRNVG